MTLNESMLASDFVNREDIPTGLTRVGLIECPGPDREFVADAIRRQGYAVLEFEHLRELLVALGSEQKLDLLLVAFKGNQATVLAGIQLLQRFIKKLPPLLLLMRPEQLERAEVFSMGGATDFILFPCDECELVARVSNALGMADASLHAPNCNLTFGRYKFDPKARAVSFNGKRVCLQPREFNLALFLFRNAGHAQSRERIFKAVWGLDLSHAPTRTLDVHAARLRKRLNLVPSNDATLQSVRSFGYELTLYTY